MCVRAALTALGALLLIQGSAAWASTFPGGNVFAGAAPPRNVPGELIVRFRTGTSAGERRDTRRDADTTFDHSLVIPRAQLLEAEKGQSVAAAVRELNRDPDVLYAEPTRRFVSTAAPDDPLFGEQWALDNAGQVIKGHEGSPGSDIGALSAWSITTGSPSVLVAVVDTGIDRSHP